MKSLRNIEVSLIVIIIESLGLLVEVLAEDGGLLLVGRALLVQSWVVSSQGPPGKSLLFMLLHILSVDLLRHRKLLGGMEVSLEVLREHAEGVWLVAYRGGGLRISVLSLFLILFLD